MKSFLDISLPTANSIFNAANIVLIVGCVLVAVGTVAVFWSAGIRDRYADERISGNELETARANESAAVANQKAAEAELKLEQFKAPRNLSTGQIAQMASALTAFAGTDFDMSVLPNDPEAADLLPKIETILAAAGWVQVTWKGGILVNQRPNKPDVGIVTATGVVIQMHPENVKKFEPLATAFGQQLASAGLVTRVELGKGDYPNENRDALHVLIGKKQ